MLDRLQQPSTVKGLISIIASIAMIFTPDYIDAIIQTTLVAVGGIDVFSNDKKR